MIHCMHILDISRLYVMALQSPKVSKLVFKEVLEIHLDHTYTLKFIQEGNIQHGVEMRLILGLILPFQIAGNAVCPRTLRRPREKPAKI